MKGTILDEQSLEDLLALIEVRNITRAARRRNVSQPAYSRRLRAIEANHGIALVERSLRPAQPTPALDALRDEIELALAGLKRLRKNLARGSAIDHYITIAAVHSLASSLVPVALKKIGAGMTQQRIRLRSANQEACFQMLMMEEVSLMLAYETADWTLQAPRDLVEKTTIATDWLVPACTPELAPMLMKIVPGSESIPLIAYPYPSDVFLGRVLSDDVVARTPHQFLDTLVTGLTTAALAAACAGVGLAWLPLSLIKGAVDSRELIVLDSPLFPIVELNVSMLQLRTRNMLKMRPWLKSLADAIANTASEFCGEQSDRIPEARERR